MVEYSAFYSAGSEVVCLKCGLAQPYITAERGVATCQRGKLLGPECDGLICETLDAFAE
ncbi:MAG: hypothetical protein H0U46_04880 [Actinobacteria bacterium]|nr:hypothetical protein [Actinomycetota bacterium]